MKQRIKGGKQSEKKKKVVLPKPVYILVNRILPILVLLGVGFYFAPKVSLAVQNNDVKGINGQVQSVMFYSSECGDCQKVYPVVFWHNVLNFQHIDKQVQTINVANPNNQHYISEQNIERTPTFRNYKANHTDVLTDKKAVKNYIETGGMQ